jgi:lipopolysaccharide transport system ATP-binding protein
MAADVVIRAEGLGKKYVIGHQAERERVPTLRDAVARSAGRFARTAGEMLRGRPIVAGDETEEFWALKDVSFEIRRGDVVGVIGRNGAGKSTLLKVLSRITEPSAGRVEIKGRVASLLEVGTGFHPELSGRENIFLNGAILGMTREEITRKFDEIVAFAEIEKFLDTPVKRYSSGMYVRLAFAVAAHLEPEILVVDEVLAVGDADFQRKCLGKMQDVASGGRTVLFVSHNIGVIERLCSRGCLLAGGTIAASGATSAVTAAYRKRLATAPSRLADKPPSSVRIEDVYMLDESGAPVDVVASGAPANLALRYAPIPGGSKENVTIAAPFRNGHSEIVLLVRSNFVEPSLRLSQEGGTIVFRFPKFPLSPGNYTVDVRILQGSQTLILSEPALTISVEGDSFYPNHATPPPRIQCALTEFKLENM